MPRKAREISPSGYYHVVMRGNDRRIIFMSDNDKRKFLNSVDKFRDKGRVKLLAYCLMDNHVHMLIKAEMDDLSLFNQKLKDSYCFFFNRKYNHTGTLFEGRFWSRAIVGETDLIHVVRYIHRNPVKAGMAEMKDYRWSSYDEFIYGSVMCDVEELGDLWQDTDDFVSMMSVDDPDDSAIAIPDYLRLSDDEARDVAVNIMCGRKLQELSDCSVAVRSDFLRTMCEQGVSKAQLTRLTGINRGAVDRACNGVKVKRRYI